jgi:hypothetical protein
MLHPNFCTPVAVQPASSSRHFLTILPLPSCSCFRGIFSGQRCACWEGDAQFSSSFGLSCTIHFQAGEGDMKRAVRSMGRMLRFWGSDSGTPPPPDIIQADIVDDSGQVIPATAVRSTSIISRGARPGATGCECAGRVVDRRRCCRRHRSLVALNAPMLHDFPAPRPAAAV